MDITHYGPAVTIEATVRLQPHHVEQALWLTLRRHTPGLRLLPITLVGALSVPLMMGVLVASGTTLPPIAMVFALLCGALALGAPLALRALARRSMTPRGAALVFKFDDDGFVVNEGESVHTFLWKRMYEAVQTQSVLVLYEKPSVFHIIPLSDLGDDRSTLEALIAEHLPQTRRAINVFGWLSPGFVTLVLLGSAALFLLGR